MWNKISSKNDLKNFMDKVYHFHDSCLKELKYVSGAYADECAMYSVNDKRILSVIFQGVCGKEIDFSVIEIEFIGLIKINMIPINELYSCEIHSATMILKNDYIYWYDSDNVPENELDNYKGILICASEVRWRIADEYLGSGDVYVLR